MKKILALTLIASLCLSACSGTGGESSTSNSSTSTSESLTSSSSAVEQSASSSSGSDTSASTTTDGALTLEEIKAIFSELDAKRNDMVKWVLKDYSKIPIDNVPVRKMNDVVVKWIGTENTFISVPGTAVFAKVTDKTLPGFPWKNTKEIEADILKIYKSISDNTGFEYMVSTDFNDPNGLFYQFEDGLYFRTNYEIYGGYLYWDYSTIKIIENKPDEIRVSMYEIEDTGTMPTGRTLVKNDSGNWVIGSSF